MRVGVTHYVKLDKVFENIRAISRSCLLEKLVREELDIDIGKFNDHLLEEDADKALLQLERVKSDIIDLDAFVENFKIILIEYKKLLTQPEEGGAKNDDKTQNETDKEFAE